MPYKDKNKAREHAKEYNKKWYQIHKEEVIERRKKRQIEIRNWFRRYKSTLSCTSCGINHPAVLQFHHQIRADKSFTIGDVASRASSLKQITEEIEKCVVLCVNCHAKLHWREIHRTDDWEEVMPLEE